MSSTSCDFDPDTDQCLTHGLYTCNAAPIIAPANQVQE